MKVKTPGFAKNKDLARYVPVSGRKTKFKRAHSSVFMDKAGSNGLSVNSLEIHSLKQIKDVYQRRFNDVGRPMAIAVHSVGTYIDALCACGVTIVWNRGSGRWEHITGGASAPSIVHDPRPGLGAHNAPKDDSHTLVSGWCALAEKKKRLQFANIMIRKPPYREVY